MEHTIPVAVMVQEEKVVVAEAEKAVFGAANASIYGANGEKVLLDFLRKYLPSCFRLTSGHALRSDGQKSPEIDLMLVDSRFSPLSVHKDGTTLEMREAVLGVVSVKKQLAKRDIEEQERYSLRISEFFTADLLGNDDSSGGISRSPFFYIIIYRSKMLEKTVLSHLENVVGLRNPLFTLFCLRMPKSDLKRGLGQGAIFRYDRGEADVSLFSVFSTAPLSDFYFMMLSDAYGMLDERFPTYESLRLLLMDYYNWGRVSPEIYEEDEDDNGRREVQ